MSDARSNHAPPRAETSGCRKIEQVLLEAVAVQDQGLILVAKAHQTFVTRGQTGGTQVRSGGVEITRSDSSDQPFVFILRCVAASLYSAPFARSHLVAQGWLGEEEVRLRR